MNKFKSFFLASAVSLFLVSCGGGNSIEESVSQPEPSIDERPCVPVFILMGQSNMEGNTKAESYLEAFCNETGRDYAKMNGDGYENVLTTFWNHYSNQSYNYSGPKAMEPRFLATKVGFGVNKSHTYFGPEVGMSEILDPLSNEENPIHFIKFTSGGTGFKNEVRDGITNWNWQNDLFNPGYLYLKSLEYITASLNEIENKGFKPIVKGICWVQGDQDAWDHTAAVCYYDNLKSMLEGYREYLEDYAEDGNGNNISFIDVTTFTGLNQYGTGPFLEFANVVNEAKVRLASEPNNYLIDGNALNIITPNPSGDLGGDMYHLGAGDMIKLGNEIGKVIKNNIRLY